MPEIKDLQKLIDERAARILEKDIRELSTLIRAQNLFQHNGESWPPGLKIGDTKEQKIMDIFQISVYENIRDSDSYIGKLYKHWLPIYISNESAKFLKDIDTLKNKASQLENDVQNLLDNQQGDTYV